MSANQPEMTGRRVVAGVDGSPNSLLALRRAVHSARLRHACVELVRVLPPDATPATGITGLGALAMAVRCEFPGAPGVPVRLSDGHIARVYPDQYARVIPASHPAGTRLS